MIKAFDHVAIPMESVDKMTAFYSMLGCTIIEEYDGLIYSICFGDNKINFHTPKLWKTKEFKLRGKQALPGCGDFCFVWEGSLPSLYDALRKVEADIEEGPVKRTGGKDGGSAKGTSIYTRDPDDNLLEFIIY